MDDKVKTVQVLFERHKFHHLLVVDEKGLLVGIISDHDLLKAISPFISRLSERPQDLRTMERPVHQIMEHKPIKASKDSTLKEAAVLMFSKSISCLPIVHPDGTIVGIVTWKDILKSLVERLDEDI
jgi:acetoin utilization protein AcuB